MLKQNKKQSVDNNLQSTEDADMESDNEDDNSTEEMEAEAGPSSQDNDSNQSTKKKKRGIIYISSIPKHMNVTILREILSQYAKIGRMFLQPEKLPEDEKAGKKKKKRRLARHFTEGWVEFESKRAAKQVALKLNTTPIATRKSSKFYDILWSMKYLPRFKWVHLSERLTYEKAVHRQKLQTEISQARKEAAFFQENLDKSAKFKKQKKNANKPAKPSTATE